MREARALRAKSALVGVAIVAAGARARADGPAAAGAQLSFARNEVRVSAPREHPARAGEPLARGNRVDTMTESGAEIAFPDDTRLQLAERTQVLLLAGGLARRTPGDGAALLEGGLRARLADGAAPLRLSVGGGHRVSVDAGEALVELDADKTVRVSVLRGRSTVVSAGRRVLVAGGFGTRAARDGRPAPPQMLPAAPVWKTAPPPVVVVIDGQASIQAAYAAPAGVGSLPSAWHVQVARDARFNDTVLDARVPAATTALRVDRLDGGAYFARVSAVDADLFEGRPSPVARVDVIRGKVDRSVAAHPTLTLPPEPMCSVDGGPLAHVSRPVALARFRDHVVRCAASADGPASEARVEGRLGAYVHVQARLQGIDRSQRSAWALVALTDVDGAPLQDVELTGTASNRARLGPLKPAGAAGTYAAALSWEPGTTSVVLHVGVNGAVEGTSNELPLADATPPGAPASAPPLGPPDVTAELALFGGVGVSGDDLGVGGVVGGEAGARWDLGGWSLSLALRPRFESYGRSGVAACGGGATAIASACDVPTPPSTYAYDLKEKLITVAVPLGVRLGERDARVLPYLAVAPGLLVESVSLEGTVSGRPESAGDTVPRLSFEALAGVELRATDDGRLFVEGGLRGSPTVSRPWGDSHAQSVLVVGGWRGGL